MRRASGLFGYLQHNWLNLNGRWATSTLRFFADSIIGLDARYGLTVPASIACIFFGFWFFISTVVKQAADKLVFSSMMSLIFIALASKISELLFWSTGLTDYTFGYLLSGISFYLMISVAQDTSNAWRNWRLYVGAVVLFFNAGMSELFLVPISLLLAYLVFFNVNRIAFLLPSLSFAIGAMLNVFAIGTSMRIDRVDNDFNIQLFLSDALLYGARGLLLPVLALFLLSHVWFIRKPLQNLCEKCNDVLSQKVQSLLTVFALVYPFIVIIALVLSLGSPGPGRAHNVSLFALVLLWPLVIVKLSALAPKTFRFKIANRTMLVLGLVVLIAINVKDLFADLSGDVYTYNRHLDQARQTLALTENQGKHVILSGTAKRPNIASGGGFIVTVDTNNWVNQCVAMYYLNTSTVWAP